MAGKENVISSVPFGFGEWGQQGGAIIVEIAGEPAPPVIPAKGIARFHQGDPHLGMALADGQRGQPARQPTAHDGHIDRAPVHRGQGLGMKCGCGNRVVPALDLVQPSFAAFDMATKAGT